jgi:hypothetical protein
MTVFDPKYFLIMNFVTNFFMKNLGLDPDRIRIQQKARTGSGFSKIPGSGFSEFGSKNCQYHRSTKNDGRGGSYFLPRSLLRTALASATMILAASASVMGGRPAMKTVLTRLRSTPSLRRLVKGSAAYSTFSTA